MFDSGMVAASVGVPADLVVIPKRLEGWVAWDELFLGIVAAGVGVPADLVVTPKRLVDCVTWEELFLGIVTAGVGVPKPKRLEDCVTWEESFLGRDTDATCAVVVVAAVKNENGPAEAGSGALEDCATGPTGLRDCETW